MAQKKRPSPLDEPPTASSSESEEEDQQPLSPQHEEEEVAASSEEEDGEASTEEEDDDEEENHQPSSLHPAAKNPPLPSTNSNPKPSSSESATESDSGTESEPEPDSSAPGSANPKVKPLASKPMEQTPKARSQASAAPARSGSKRVAENNMHATDPKRSRKKVTVSGLAAVPFDKEVEEDGKKSGDDPKKLFQRIWSEEDEIAILKGMVEFSSKTDMDPLKLINEFHDFVKKSLHVDASVNQLKEKIRRLKKKFETNAGKKGKNGEGPKFYKAHEQKSFELSKKIWANGDGGVTNGAVEKAKSNGKAAKIPKEGTSSVRNAASPKKSKPEINPETNPNPPSLGWKESEKMDIDIPNTNLALSEMIRFGKSGTLFGLNEDVIKGGLELMDAPRRAELEERWNKLQVAELELFAKRAQLIGDQARLILEAYKSSNH